LFLSPLKLQIVKKFKQARCPSGFEQMLLLKIPAKQGIIAEAKK